MRSIRKVLFSLAVMAGLYPTVMNAQSKETIFPLEMKQPSSFNVGDVFMGMLKSGEGTTMVCNFLFEKGSRNAWHTHPIQQCLLVLSGEGYYQEEGKPKQLLRKGDWVVTPVGVPHWNGATPDNACECITITDYAEPHVDNLRKVTDEEFNTPVEYVKVDRLIRIGTH